MRKISMIAFAAIALCACDKQTSRFELNCETWDYGEELDGYRQPIARKITAVTYKNHAVLTIDGKEIKLSLDKECPECNEKGMFVYTGPIADSEEKYVYKLYEQNGRLANPFIGFESRPDENSYRTRYANCKVIDPHQ